MSFSIFRAVGLVLRTWPFLLLRMAVSSLIGLAYAFATGAGVGIGWMVGQFFPPDGGAPGALLGGVIGFCVAGGIWFWVRAWLFYMVQAGHVAALTLALDNRPLPPALGQVGYALSVVRERFLEVNALFVLDQLVKAAAASVIGLLCGLIAFARLPGLDGLMSFIGAVLRMSTQFVDEIILAYNVRNRSKDPWHTAQDALVLYAQNGWTILGNAVTLTVLMALVWVLLFALIIAPAGAFAFYAPGPGSYASFAASAVLAYVLAKAFMEPFCIACLMQVFFAATQGQAPDPTWRGRLSGVSRKFEDLGRQAAASF